MARLPYVRPENAPEPVRKVFERLPVHLNLFRMLANAETLFRPFLGLGSAILNTMKLDAKARELVILHVGRLCRGEYEWVQHVPIAEACAVTRTQIDALERGETTVDCFDERERALLAFTTELVRDVQVSEQTFRDASKHLDAREIVETIVAVGFYMTVARLTEATQIEIDPGAGMKMVESARKPRIKDDSTTKS